MVPPDVSFPGCRILVTCFCWATASPLGVLFPALPALTASGAGLVFLLGSSGFHEAFERRVGRADVAGVRDLHWNGRSRPACCQHSVKVPSLLLRLATRGGHSILYTRHVARDTLHGILRFVAAVELLVLMAYIVPVLGGGFSFLLCLYVSPTTFLRYLHRRRRDSWRVDGGRHQQGTWDPQDVPCIFRVEMTNFKDNTSANSQVQSKISFLVDLDAAPV